MKVIDRIVSSLLVMVICFSFISWMIAGLLLFTDFIAVYASLDITRTGLQGFVYGVLPLFLLASGLFVWAYFLFKLTSKVSYFRLSGHLKFRARGSRVSVLDTCGPGQ